MMNKFNVEGCVILVGKSPAIKFMENTDDLQVTFINNHIVYYPALSWFKRLLLKLVGIKKPYGNIVVNEKPL